MPTFVLSSSRMRRPLVLASLAFLLSTSASAENEVKDNSFLVEEAYNQDAGVVQHVTGAVLSGDRDAKDARLLGLTLAQEWPIFSERHQLSWELPWSGSYLAKGPEWEPCCTGIDDVEISYRYALLLEDPELPALAPRISLLLPTGDEQRGHSTGEIGFGFAVPVSKELGKIAIHANAGIEWTPGVSPELPAGVRGRERDLVELSLGGSTIFVGHPRVQPLVEVVTIWGEEIEDTGLVRRTRETLVSPGVRWGAPVSGGMLVLGAAAPIGIGEDAPPWSALLYVSFEHAFRKQP